MTQAYLHNNKLSVKSIKHNKLLIKSKIRWSVFVVKRDRILNHQFQKHHFLIFKNIFQILRMIFIMMKNISLFFFRMISRQSTIQEKGIQMHMNGINILKIRRTIQSHSMKNLKERRVHPLTRYNSIMHREARHYSRS